MRKTLLEVKCSGREKKQMVNLPIGIAKLKHIDARDACLSTKVLAAVVTTCAFIASNAEATQYCGRVPVGAVDQKEIRNYQAL